MARSRLGPLALESKIGDPVHSTVWRAVHVELRRSLAVKIFHVPFGGTAEARQEFAREWETLKRLRHGAIARCYGGGFEDSDAYLAYEIVQGESLAERVERRQRLPWETVLVEAEHVLRIKLGRGARLTDEGERLYAAAREYERFGDSVTALDKYRSLVTLLADEPRHRPYVNLARRQIAHIQAEGNHVDERQRLITRRLEEADRLMAEGQTIEARKIWYSIIELYDNNLELEPLVSVAHQRIEGSDPASSDPANPRTRQGDG